MFRALVPLRLGFLAFASVFFPTVVPGLSLVVSGQTTDKPARPANAKIDADAATDIKNEGKRNNRTNSLGGLSIEQTEQTIAISAGDRTILVYNKLSPPVPEGIDPIFARSGFLHPVRSLGGQTITAAFPADHAHQHGIFSAWVKTTYQDRQVDFWNLAGKTGRVEHVEVLETFNHSAGTGFSVDLRHKTVDPEVAVLSENWRVVAYPTDGKFICFDLQSLQTAITETPLQVEEHNYGGFAFRGRVEWVNEKQSQMAGKTTQAFRLLNDAGSDRLAGNHEHSRWVAMEGEIDGRTVSMVMLCHPDNFRAPQAARLHPTKPYFCFAPCVDGEFTIDQDHPLKSRYRFLVTDAPLDERWINMHWENWCGEQSIAPVSGVVTLEGQPLRSAQVTFYPDLGGQTSTAVTDKNGQYELRLDEQTSAAKVGRGIVIISTAVWDPRTEQWSQEMLEEKYSKRGLPIIVAPRENRFDFDLY